MSYQIKRTPYYRRIFNNSRRNGQLQRLREEYERIQEFNDRTIELKMRQVRLKRLFREIDDINEPPHHGHGPAHGGQRVHSRAPPPPLLPLLPEARLAQERRLRLESLERARELGQEISRRNAQLAETGTGFYLRSEIRNTSKMRAADEARREAQERRQRAARRISYGNEQSRSNVERILQRRQRQEVAEAILYRNHAYAAQLVPVESPSGHNGPTSPEIVKRSMLQQRLQYGNSRSSKNMMRSQLIAAQRVMNCISITDVVTAKEIRRLRRQNDCTADVSGDDSMTRVPSTTYTNQDHGRHHHHHHNNNRIERSHRSHRHRHHHHHHRHHHHHGNHNNENNDTRNNNNNNNGREQIEVDVQRNSANQLVDQERAQRAGAGGGGLTQQQAHTVSSYTFMDPQADSNATITVHKQQERERNKKNNDNHDGVGDRNVASGAGGVGGVGVANNNNHHNDINSNDTNTINDDDMPTTSQRAMQHNEQPTVHSSDPWHRLSMPLPWFKLMQNFPISDPVNDTVSHQDDCLSVNKLAATEGNGTDNYQSIQSVGSMNPEDTMEIMELDLDDNDIIDNDNDDDKQQVLR